MSILGRDDVDDILIGTDFDDKFYSEQLVGDDASSDTVSYETSIEGALINVLRFSVLEDTVTYGTGTFTTLGEDQYFGFAELGKYLIIFAKMSVTTLQPI